jgi:RNA polymerase sigma-70 factor (ECF subfamily)
MDASDDDRERPIRAAFDVGDLDAATTLALELYGREIFGFLAARSPSQDVAGDIFGQFCEDFWRSMRKFEWRCSIRTWAYKLARHAAHNDRSKARRAAGAVPLSQLSHLSVLVDRVRTETCQHLKTEVKSQLQQLREQLPPDDQTLLILRVDRGMSWRELAEVMWSEPEAATEEELGREAAKLRKRFQVAKERLRELVEQAGLLERDA